MALIDEIRRRNPSLSDRSDAEIKSFLRQSPEFQHLSDSEFDRFVSGSGQPAEQDETPGFTGGLSAGLDQMQAMGGGLIMAAGEASEDEDLLNAGRDIYQRNMEEAGQNDLGYGFTDIRSAGDAWNWARYTAGNMLPMLATSALGGGVGGAAASTGAKMLAGQAAKQTAARAGQALGALTASTGMETGSMMGETEDLDVSLAHGVLAGSLDAVTPIRLLRGAGKHELADQAADEISNGVLASLRREAGRSAAGAAGRGSLTSLMTEASTEGLQGLINQHANYWVENNGESLLNNLDQVDVKAIIDEAAAGGLMGGLAGAPTGIAERGQARSQVQRIDAAREQAAAQGGDALDQTMAAQEAEQTSAPTQWNEDVADPRAASDVGNRLQIAIGELDDLENLARGSSYQGRTRLRNISTILDRAEKAYEEGKVDQAQRLTARAEAIAANLRGALQRAGTRERPMEGEVLDPETLDQVAGLIGQDFRRLPEGDPNTIYASGPTVDSTEYEPQATNVRRDENLRNAREGAEQLRNQARKEYPQLPDARIVYGDGPVAGNANTGMDQPVPDSRSASAQGPEQAPLAVQGESAQPMDGATAAPAAEVQEQATTEQAAQDREKVLEMFRQLGRENPTVEYGAFGARNNGLARRLEQAVGRRVPLPEFRALAPQADREAAYREGQAMASEPQPAAGQQSQLASPEDDTNSQTENRNSDSEPKEDGQGSAAMYSRAPQTDTEAFREWFGDSKVVDESGQPLIVYHGTRQEFDVFDMSRTGENTPYTEDGLSGAHFHSDYEDAEFYTEPEDLDGNQREGDSPRVVEAYLSLQNPLTVDVEKNETNYFDQNTNRLLDIMEDGGHDGIIVNGKDGSLYFVPTAEQIKSATDNTGAFDPANPDIRYSQPDRTGYRRTPNTRVQSMTAEQAQRIANVLMKNWKGKPPMIVAEEISEFPDGLQAAIRQAGAENDMRAVFWDKKVFVLAPRIPSRLALEEVILHEVVGHYGLRKMMGDNLKMLLERVYRDLGDSRQAEQLKQTYFGGNFNARNQEHRLTIAEELIAHLAESGKHQYRTLFEKILTVVRNSLRRMGFTFEITERDLLAILDGADKVVRNGGISVPSSADIHFSRSDYENARNGVDSEVEGNDAPPLPDVEEITDDSETQRILDRYEQRASQSEVRRTTVGGREARADWREKTVIRDGEQPGFVFRGAAQQLTPEDFSAARRGYNTRHPSAALGTFFTNSDQDAARYGSVYPYNLDLRNPHVVKGEDLPSFNDPAEAEQYRADLEAEGYDGIVIDYTGLGGPQHIVPFEPESVLPVDEKPMFSRVGNRLESAEDHFADLTAAQRTALGKIAPRTPKEKATEWLSERLDRWSTKLRQGLVDRFAALKELDENLYGRDVVENSTASSSWVLAQMSGAASGALQAMLTAGRLKFNQEQKVIDVRDGDAKGLNDTLKQLGSAAEIERFFGWIAGNRSKRLMAEGRENLFELSEVEALSTLNRGRTDDGKSRAALYREVFKEFQQYRDDVLEIAEQTGTITSEQRQIWANEFYVPFYRLADDEGGFTGPKASGGISRQEAYKRLKGGSQNLNDLLENTMMNFHHLLQTSLKNQAALQAMDNAQELGIARKVREADRNTENSTFVLRDGQKIWYEIDDPLVFKAVTALAHPGMNSAAMKVMRGFKRVFTNMTTTTPQFVVANLLRDSMQASATSEVSKNFMRNIAEGTKAYGDQRTRARMMASGGSFSFGHLYGENADEMRLQLTGELSRADILRQPSMVPNALRLMWRKWNDMTDFTENVNRAAIFEQNAESRGELYAAFKARDLMNFSQHGAWPAVRILIDIVPFLNARLQGLDKIYRSGVKPGILSAMGKGTVSDKQAAQRFWTVTGAITMATIALYLNNEDDEEYAKLEDWQKDTYWFFRVSEDHAIFIPKPFEVGAIATLAERVTEQAVSDTATGELFKERLMHMVMDTFSFSPIPQAFQPALDVYANYDAFTGRPIENMGMQRLSPELRRRNSTTMPADVGSAISRGVASVWGGEGLSPVQVDHMIQGYLGSVGSWGAGIIDTIWRTANGETSPDRRWYEFQPVRRFYGNLGDEDRYTRYGTLFYDSLKETRRVYADIKEYQELGQMEDARELAQKNATSLRYRTTLNRMQRKLSKLNKSMQQIQRMDASSEYKRRELDRIRAIKNQMLETIGQRLERLNDAS